MKKIACLLISWGLLITSAGAAKLPDNMYFKAMKQEMDRSLKKLHSPGGPKPSYIAYKLENYHVLTPSAASLGALYPRSQQDDVLTAYVWVDVGTAQHNSVGYVHDAYYAKHAYRARRGIEIPKGYHALRQDLWQLTDKAYVFASEVYQQKQAYLRTKALDPKTQLPDFVPQKQSSYVQEVAPLPLWDESMSDEWVRKFSARGKPYAFLEQFYMEITPIQQEIYYLNSLGGFYQQAFTFVHVRWKAQLRNKDGFKQERTQEIWLPWNADMGAREEEILSFKTNQFLENLEALYAAIPPQMYLGPVLLGPAAAGQFLESVFVKNIQNLKTLLPENAEAEEKTGTFEDKLNQRVISNAVNLYDYPDWSNYHETPLGGFMPVDDEGVASQPLQLTEQGRLVNLPRTSRPLEKGARSNGHARLTVNSLPRERLTNLYVQAKEPKTWEELKSELIQKCRELDLEYGYILYDFSAGDGTVLSAERVYVDGTTRPVYGLRVNELTTRTLRDIRAAGAPENNFITHTKRGLFEKELPSQSIISPALLLEELELGTDKKKADKAPFVKKP